MKVKHTDLNIIEIDGEEYFANYDQESFRIFKQMFTTFCVSLRYKRRPFDAMEGEFVHSASKIALENLLNYCIFRLLIMNNKLFEVRNRNSAGLQGQSIDSLEPLTAEDILEI